MWSNDSLYEKKNLHLLLKFCHLLRLLLKTLETKPCNNEQQTFLSPIQSSYTLSTAPWHGAGLTLWVFGWDVHSTTWSLKPLPLWDWPLSCILQPCSRLDTKNPYPIPDLHSPRIQPPLRAPAACRFLAIYVISMEFLCVNRRRLSPLNAASGQSAERQLHSQARTCISYARLKNY